jgi:hypothetical protein
MIKLVYCIRKAAEISAEEFHRYWLEDHGPRVRGHAVALGASRYVQSHTQQSELNEAVRGPRGAAPAYDGITEMWWRDEATLRETLGTDDARTAALDLLEDERHFIDLEASSIFLTQEHEIFSN